MIEKKFNKIDMIKLQDVLRKNKKTITVAESCTGGLISSMITKVSGSSDIFNGSIIAYSNYVKEQELNVSSQTLKNFGAVSYQTVNEMLNGVIKKFGADYALATSGIAGPNGGSFEKPVGTVIIGISDGKQNYVEKVYLTGNRNEIQNKAVNISFNKFLQFLLKTLDN